MNDKLQKERYSSWSIFYSIVFVVLLILLGERAWGDFDKYFNPLYDFCYQQIEFSRVVNIEAVGPQCDAAAYEANRLVFHIALVVPLLIIMQLIYYGTAHKQLVNYQRLMIRSYFIFMLWMVVHLFGEIAIQLFRYYSEFGFYVIVGFIALVFAGLIVMVQRREHEKQKDELNKTTTPQ